MSHNLLRVRILYSQISYLTKQLVNKVIGSAPLSSTRTSKKLLTNLPRPTKGRKEPVNVNFHSNEANSIKFRFRIKGQTVRLPKKIVKSNG